MEAERREVIVGRLPRAVVRILAPADEAIGILDDLEEEAAQIAAASGRGAATRWVRWQIVHSAGPWIGRRARESAAQLQRSAKAMRSGWWSDVRIAVRRLAHSRGFSALAVATLAIGVCAVASVFGLAYALWLKPLPYVDPDRLVWIGARHEPSGTTAPLTVEEFAVLERDNRALSGVASFFYGATIARVNDEPVRNVTHFVSPNLFRVLGVRPAIGRDFTDADATPGSHVVMLSHAFWAKRFGRDPAIAGKSLSMDGASYTIAGVMPPGFTFPRVLEADAWIPSDLSKSEHGTARLVQAIGRLAAERSLADAESDAKARIASLPRGNSDDRSRWTASLTPAGATASRSGRVAFQALLGIVGLFLLISCTNIAGLLLARNTGRRVEFAVCLSIGASRWRLARTLLIESVLLAAAGCAAGTLLASSASRAVAALMPPKTPGLDDVGVGGVVIALAVAVAMVSAVLIGVVPVLGLRAMRPAEALTGVRGVAHGMTRVQRGLVIVEIALAVVMVVGASVMLRALVGLLDRDRGYDPRGLVAMNVSLPFSNDSYLPTAIRARAFDEILERVRTVPGVRAAAATTGFPGSPLGILGGAPFTPPGASEQVVAAIHAASAGYFETMGIPIKAGRPFLATDATTAAGVAIVNEQLAREFPDGNPIGHQISLTIQGDQPRWFEIVGIAGNIRLTDRAGLRVFVPLSQASPYWIDLVVRGDGRAALLTDVRRTLRGLNPDLLLENDSSFSTIIGNSLALERAQSAFAGAAAVLAVVVAGVGLYGLMSVAIAQRRREMGIRLALGSPPRRLLLEAMAIALRLAVVGVVIGEIITAALIRALGATVFGLGSATPGAYAGAAGLVLVVAIVAASIPARRVLRTDPLVALRAN